MKKIVEYTMIFEIYLACAISCLAMLGYNSAASLAISVNFITVFALFVMTVFYQRHAKAGLFIPLLLIIVLSFVGVFISKSSISFNYLKKWIMFSCTIMIYYCAAEISVTQRIISTIFRGSLVVALFFLGMYVTGNHYIVANAITLNLSNSNFAGICILCVVLCLSHFIWQQKTLLRKILFVSLIGFLLYLLMLTHARACIFAIAAYLLLALFWRTGYKKWLTLLFLLFPLLFAIVYLLLIENSAVQNFFSFLVGYGKTLTARVGIWKYAFNILKSNYIFGNYYTATAGTGMSQLHNLSVDVLATFGVPVFICMTVYLWNIINKIGCALNSRRQMIPVFAYYALMISGTFEAALFSGSQGMYVLSAGLLMLARYNKEECIPTNLGDHTNDNGRL